jgi:hypothetical protein
LFVVSISYDDDIGNYIALGTAYYDQSTNRIIRDGSVGKQYLCISGVFRI